MEFVNKWLRENKEKGKEPFNIQQLAKKIGEDRSKLDRWLGKTKNVIDRPQQNFNVPGLKKIRLAMKLSRDEFYARLESEFED